jgi:ligand-binding SRPBCC domain-containing protein
VGGVRHECVLERSQRFELKAERAFEFFADARNLELITPPWLGFKMLTKGEIEIGLGALLEYRLKVRGVPIRWQTRIELWEPPVRFVDIQLRGPYAFWEHTHSFEPDGEDAVVIGDRVRYALPLGPLGRLAHAAIVKRDLERIFAYRRQAVAEQLERRAHEGL